MKGCLIITQHEVSRLLKTKNLDQTLKSNTGELQVFIQTETNQQTEQLNFVLIQQLCSLRTYDLNIKNLSFPSSDPRYLESVLDLCEAFGLKYINEYIPQDPRTVYKKIYYQKHKEIMAKQTQAARQKRVPLSKKQLKEQLLLVLLE